LKELEVSFRRESSRILARLVARFGIGNQDRAEDAVQSAFVKATQSWPASGVPQNPGAWLYVVATHALIDGLRREQIYAPESEELAAPTFDPDALEDAELQMLFMCCHRSLDEASTTCLILHTLCGMSVAEISAGLLSTSEAISQRIVRAKRRLRESGASFSLPTGDQLFSAKDVVLRSIYLMFNEGHLASSGSQLVRSDLCDEAILLVERFRASRIGDDPAADALLALLHFHRSRFPARVAEDGSLVQLADQDRSLWDRERIAAGFWYLEASLRGDILSRYHIEAAIAGCHARAASFEATDWVEVRQYFGDLVERFPSPIACLNECVAIAMAEGPIAGLQRWEAVVSADRRSLVGYVHTHTIHGWLLERMGRPIEARDSINLALASTQNMLERQFLTRWMDRL